MSKLVALQDAIVAAGIPITRLCQEMPGAASLSPLDDLSAEQRAAAEAIIATFDWTEPPPAKPPKSLEALYFSFSEVDRTPAWNALGEWVMGRLISREVQADPDGAQAVLDKLRAEKIIKFDVHIREEG